MPGFDRSIERVPRFLEMQADLLGRARRRQLEPCFGLAELHAQPRGLDHRPGRLPKAARQSGDPQGGDEPLGRIPLIPAHAVAEVGRELVVEVVVALAVRHEGEQTVVPRGILFRVRPRSPQVGHGVDHEGRVMDHDDAKETAPEKPAERTAEQRSDHRRNPEPREDADPVVPAVLPAHEPVGLQVGHVLVAALGRLRVEEPENVRPQAPALDAVGVPVAVHVSVMVPVIRGPLQGRVLEGHRAEEEVNRLEQRMGDVALVGEAAVVARRDREADQAEEGQEENRLPPDDPARERVGGRPGDSGDRRQGKKEDVEPVLLLLLHVFPEKRKEIPPGELRDIGDSVQTAGERYLFYHPDRDGPLPRLCAPASSRPVSTAARWWPPRPISPPSSSAETSKR